MIGVINYGVGNINSVINMIKKVGGEVSEVKSPNDLHYFNKLILPGVGAFDHCMQSFKQGGWKEPLDRLVSDNKVPIMGICVGMQMLGHSSEEGSELGLGWINAKTVKITRRENIKIPHMGWNKISVKKENELFTNADLEQRFYFVHSYRVECLDPENIIATTFHGEEVVAFLQKNKVYGAQFHPEKSHSFGMELFQKFVGMTC